MDILFSEITRTNLGIYVTASTDKTDASFSFYKDGSVQVCCKNASHRVWGGMGRNFRSVTEAMDGYKSAAMKAMIRCAADLAQDADMLATS